MMNLNKLFAKTIAGAFTALALLLPITATAITPGSVPYQDQETSGTTFPAFNIFSGVPSVGNEGDFIRVKKDGEANSTLRNAINADCKTGDRFDVWFYLHNGAKPSLNNNGTGPGVAKDVVAKVALPAQTGSPITGGVTASNAQAISDTATISCNGKQFKLKYVENSANAFLDMVNKTVPLPAAFVGNGTPIGSELLNGQVWGCWDQRVWMGLKVEVEEVPVVPPSLGECKAANIVADPDPKKRKVSVTSVTPQLTNATVVGHKIDWGDGTTPSTKETDTHTYAKDGTYTVTVSIQVKFADGRLEWKTASDCAKQVTFKNDAPPVVVATTPAVLPKTGAGDVAGIFTAFTIGGAAAHRVFQSRRYRD